MYGMVNRALEEMITEQHGAVTWERIRSRAGVTEPAFLSLTSYPDAVSYSLVGAACEELGVAGAAFLEDFGRFWIRFALRSSYGPALRGIGNSLEEALPALDQLHARVALAFPEMKPPGFRVDKTATELRLHYLTDRPGLGPFVVGLILGLAEHYGEDVSVIQVEDRATGAPHDVFAIRPQA